MLRKGAKCHPLCLEVLVGRGFGANGHGGLGSEGSDVKASKAIVRCDDCVLEAVNKATL